MNAKTFTITQDGKTKTVTLDRETRAGSVSLQLEMLWYDLWHGTHYRQIRNQLAREQRNRAFEARLGLTRVGKN